METLRKILDFALLVCAVLAAIGGTAYLFFDGHNLFGVTNIVLVVLAYPSIKKAANELLGNEGTR